MQIFQFSAKIAGPKKGRGPYLGNRRSEGFETLIRTPQCESSEHFKVVIELSTPFRSWDMIYLSLRLSRFQMAIFYGLWTFLLGKYVVRFFFGGYWDPIGHIGEGIDWLPIIFHFGPYRANFPLL